MIWTTRTHIMIDKSCGMSFRTERQAHLGQSLSLSLYIYIYMSLSYVYVCSSSLLFSLSLSLASLNDSCLLLVLVRCVISPLNRPP